jgi:hypothetical protein
MDTSWFIWEFNTSFRGSWVQIPPLHQPKTLCKTEILKSHSFPYGTEVINMNKTDKKINEKIAPKINPANAKVLPFDDGSKKKKVK